MSSIEFETFEHGADIGIRGYGHTIEQAFINGAKCLFFYMYDLEDLKKESKDIDGVKEIDIHLEADDLISLFIKWLNTLIAESDINSTVFFDFYVKILDLKLKARALGISRDKVEAGVEVKGATFTEAKVEKKDGIWIAQCVVDV